MGYNKEKFKVWEDANKDSYGSCCVQVAKRVMELMDDGAEIKSHDLICKADDDIKAGGITMFMASCVARMVIECHDKGEQFRKDWNKDYNHDGEGIVNPAVITIKG